MTAIIRLLHITMFPPSSPAMSTRWRPPQAVIDGRTECKEMPHADTLRIMELMDSLRRDWNLTYPFER